MHCYIAYSTRLQQLFARRPGLVAKTANSVQGGPRRLAASEQHTHAIEKKQNPSVRGLTRAPSEIFPKSDTTALEDIITRRPKTHRMILLRCT